MSFAEFILSIRPAFLMAETIVDRSGMLAAAVAAGWVAMLEKLPAPVAGMDEQPGPIGSEAADAPGASIVAATVSTDPEKATMPRARLATTGRTTGLLMIPPV
ncbi:hypothetical protein GCM10009780_73900 [Actinomadura alba]